MQVMFAGLFLATALADLPWIGDGRPDREGAVWYEDDPAPVFEADFVLPKDSGFRHSGVLRVEIASPCPSVLSVFGSRPAWTCQATPDAFEHGTPAFPLWSPFDKTVYSETLELRAGEGLCPLKDYPATNTLRVVLGNGWYNMPPLRFWGSISFRDHLATGRPCFKLAIEGIDSLDWRCSELPCLTRNSFQLGIVLDMRRPLKAEWRTAVPVRGPKGPIGLSRVPRIGKPTDDPLPSVKGAWVREGSVQVLDFGENRTGAWRFAFTGAKPGDRIEIVYGELLNADGSVNPLTQTAGQIKNGNGGPGAPEIAMQKDVLIVGDDCSEKVRFQTALTWHVGRYVEIRGARELVEEAVMMPLGSGVAAVEPGRSFVKRDDADLEAIHDMCVRTFRSNLMGVQSDCPGRERLGYGGDIVATCEAFMLNFDMLEFYLKTLRDFADEAEDDGWITETAPYVGIADKGFGGRSGPVSWALVVPTLMDGLLRHYPDAKDRVLAYYPVCARYVRLLDAKCPDGLVPRCIGDHEALERAPDGCVATAHWHEFVRLTASFARLLGRNADAVEFDGVAAKVKTAFVSTYVKDGVIANGTLGAQATGLYLKLVPEAQIAAAEARLVKAVRENDYAPTTGIFSTRYLLMYLSEHGQCDLAERIVRHKGYPGWLYMIDRGATTLWESWKESADVYSNCHPMFGSVDEWILRFGRRKCESNE